MKRALLSVSDKRDIESFAKGLIENGYEIISTGGTKKRLLDAGIPVVGVSDITGFPECLDGRVKTLHPVIHGGILARRDMASHMDQLKELNISTIDVVCINLYPFKETIQKDGVSLADAIENIDIGGPTMLRSAAKNHQDVIVVTDPEDYERVLASLQSEELAKIKYELALKVFEHTAHYDAMIAAYLTKQLEEPIEKKTLTLTYEKASSLRYGENPHQSASFYQEVVPAKGTLAHAKQLHGKELSFNNINDTNGALEALKEFEDPCVVAVKHTNPCGVGVGYDIFDAYTKAYEGDPVSIFGGIIAANRTIDAKTATKINEIFIEIVVAPGYDEDALAILQQKKNIRILELKDILTPVSGVDMKRVGGGMLVQDVNHGIYEEIETEVVTDRLPTDREWKDLAFAMKVAKHIKSNGIVVANDGQTLGVGPGQVCRIWAVENAIRQSVSSTKGAVLASDAFFPFTDGVEAAAKAGITAVIQPGGAKGDQAVIDACNKFGIAMVMTKKRHFKH